MTVMTSLFCRVAVALSVIATALPAQSSRPYFGSGVIRLTLNDTSANPLRKPFDVWVAVPPQQGGSTASGFEAQHRDDNSYYIDGLPDGRVTVRVVCPSLRGGAYDRSFDFVVHRAAPLDTTIDVDHAGCDTRVIRNETRVFSGFYTPGKDESRFVPCAGDSWILPSDSLRSPADSLAIPKWMWEPAAWVTWDPARPGLRERLTWPKIDERDQWGNATYFVRWQGAMTGPGRYGHVGASEFELKVESVVAIEKPTPSSCELRR